jgi:hypothetical protein
LTYAAEFPRPRAHGKEHGRREPPCLSWVYCPPALGNRFDFAKSNTHSDDELWRAIADNTNALSALVEKQCEWDAELAAPAIVCTLKSISICRADKYHREYEDYITD